MTDSQPQNGADNQNSGFDDSTSYPKHTWWYRTILGFGKLCVLPFIYRSYHIRVEKYKGKIKDPSLIVYNHTCNYDQFGVIRGVPAYKRYVASDALVRTKGYRIAFSLVNDFIFRRKGEKGDNVIRSSKVSIEKGLHVAMAPEGGESLNGVSSPIRPRTGQMVKEMGCGLVTLRLEGGYFIKPAWALERSKNGPMYGKVVHVYSKEEVAAMTPEEIIKVMADDLYINHYEWQKEHMIAYDRPNHAEFQEFILYVCPKCKSISRLHSHKDTIECECGYSVDVDEYGFYKGPDKVFDNLYEWDIWQREYIRDMMSEWQKEPEKPFFVDRDMRFELIKDNAPIVLEESVDVEMTPEYIRCRGGSTDRKFMLSDIRAITVAHRQDVAIIVGNEYYQFVPKVPTSPQKYKTALYILRGQSHLRF